jgi:hypothetical protein
MNLRTDEIGKAEDTLSELYKSLAQKLKTTEDEYYLARQEESRLSRMVESQKKELKAIAAAYKEITGKELK